MPRSRTSYRATARNKALRSGAYLEWLGVPTKRVYARERGETYQANGERERARRAKRLGSCPRLASYPNPFKAEG